MCGSLRTVAARRAGAPVPAGERRVPRVSRYQADYGSAVGIICRRSISPESSGVRVRLSTVVKRSDPMDVSECRSSCAQRQRQGDRDRDHQFLQRRASFQGLDQVTTIPLRHYVPEPNTDAVESIYVGGGRRATMPREAAAVMV